MNSNIGQESGASQNNEEHSQESRDIPTSLRDIISLMRSGGLGGEIARGTGGVFFLGIVDLLLKFMLGVLLARYLNAGGFGVYSFVMAVILILAIPVELGLPTLLVRNVSTYQTEKLWGKLKGLLLFSNVLVLVISLGIMLCTGMYIYFFGYQLNEQETKTLTAGIFLLPLIGLNSLRMATLRGLRHTVLGMTPERVVKNGVFILLLLSVPWIIPDINAEPFFAIILNLVSVTVAFLIGTWWLYRKLPSEVKKVEYTFEYKNWINSALPFLVTGGMAILNNKVDIVLLGIFRESSEVGNYEVAVRLSALIAFSYSSISYLIGPYISKLYTEKKLDTLQSLLKISVYAAFAFACCSTLVYFFAGEWILLYLFGNSFSAAYIPLLILCGGQIINVGSGFAAPLLNMTGYEKKVALALSLSTILNIGLNLLFIPKYGMVGASVTTVVTFLFWNVFLVTRSTKHLNIKTSIILLFKS